jgi:hypothetical protein
MEILIKNGTYVSAINNSTLARELKKQGALSFTKAVLDVLAESTCCTKNIIATSLTTDTISESTAAAGVTIDSVKLKDGGVTNTAGTMFAGFYPVATAQALSGAGAINVTSFLTMFTSTGAAQALTLANGTQIGQIKKIWHVVDGGSGVLTPTSLSGGTTITFTTAGEFATLIWNGTAWVAIELANYTAAGASPALA